MIYTNTLSSLFIYWLVSITYRYCFFLGGCKSIISKCIPIYHRGMYILPSCCIKKSLTRIGINLHLPLILLPFNIFEQIFLTTFCYHYNSPLNTVKLTVYEVITFRENKELLPSRDCYELYPVNNYPTEGITILIVGIPFCNQPV